MKFKMYRRVGGEIIKSIHVDVLQNDVKKDMLMRIEKRIDKEIQQQIFSRYGVVC